MNIIALADNNWAIGNNGRLLVDIPEDKKLFRGETYGKVVVMGRKTYEGLPNQSALEGRKNIVLTNNLNYKAKDVLICHSVQEVLEQLKSYDSKDVYIIGGGQIYEQFLPYCDVAHITSVDYKYDADAHFPNLDKMPELISLMAGGLRPEVKNILTLTYAMNSSAIRRKSKL